MGSGGKGTATPLASAVIATPLIKVDGGGDVCAYIIPAGNDDSANRVQTPPARPPRHLGVLPTQQIPACQVRIKVSVTLGALSLFIGYVASVADAWRRYKQPLPPITVSFSMHDSGSEISATA